MLTLSEPDTKRAIAFFDGQNLFHAVKKAFGYNYPNYDPILLAEAICSKQGWDLSKVHFYTGVPDLIDNRFWHHFWAKKLAVMGTRNIVTFSRSLRYRDSTVTLPDGSTTTVRVGQEKGIDVRIALDVVRIARKGFFDVALIFSQDQDLSEMADEVREISQQQERWIKIASAFPIGPGTDNKRGINGTDWIRIDKATYDTCIDKIDYRPKRK